jgi:hypothetical protein
MAEDIPPNPDDHFSRGALYMSSIWRNDGSTWALLSPQGFPDEQTLHDLIENGPHMLPLSADPRVVIVGREVALSGNYADLLGIEPNGRLVLIEIKLKKNAEARRAVVAQVLTYAASLAELDRDYLEQTLLAPYLIKHGFTTLADAMSSEDQSGEFQTDRFNDAIDQGLREGSFRLVLVLDEAPPELVRLVGYLESVTDKLTIDLIAVSSFDVNGSQLVVPRRIDPGHEYQPAKSQSGRPAGKTSSSTIALDGADAFISSIETAPNQMRQDLHRVANWAKSLADEGLADLSTTVGSDRWVLNVRFPSDPVGLISIWNQNGASISVWRSVFESRAPRTLDRVAAAMAPKLLGQGTTTTNLSDELLGSIGDAYREARQGTIKEVTP